MTAQSWHDGVTTSAPTSHPLRDALESLWAVDPLLTASAIALLALAVPSAAGLWLDPRLITGAPAWMKPLKFAVSTGVYGLTLAWVFTYLPAWVRTRRIVGRTTAIVMVLEVVVIDLQAWRGTTSHFNVSTPLDAALFSAMGLGILFQTLTSAAVAVALWRQPFVDAVMGWALRWGMTLTIVGASVGAVMTAGPTQAQLADARATGRMPVVGAHTVGGPDGGPGLPVTGWSTRHGDLRVPHFVGLHALQVLPLVAWMARRRRGADALRVSLAFATAYTMLFTFLVVQALRGVPLAGLS